MPVKGREIAATVLFAGMAAFSRRTLDIVSAVPGSRYRFAERAIEAIGLPVRVTAHVARHSYCSNWIRQHGQNEIEIEKLSRQVGTSVANLWKTYIHLSDSDWANVRGFGAL